MNGIVRLAMWALAGVCVATTGAAPVPAGKELVLTIPGAAQARLRMKLIPAGSFAMGSPPNENGREGYELLHEVKISKPFYMGVFEVTQAQWQAVMGNNPSEFGEKPQNPVDTVSWKDCQVFIEKLSRMRVGTFRLPTEAEWEYACRAGTRTRYSFGDDEAKLREYANYEDTPKWGDKSTAPVGSFKPNPWGLYDMHGNVWEWCSDWSGYYGPGRQTDPKGAAGGSRRVERGGSWGSLSERCRSADRYGCSPSRRNYLLGFRLVREAQ